jgi:hypothetical protein
VQRPTRSTPPPESLSQVGARRAARVERRRPRPSPASSDASENPVAAPFSPALVVDPRE